MTITYIDRKAMKSLRNPLNEALAEVGEKFGLKFELGNGSFSGSYGSFKLQIATIAEGGHVMTPDADHYKLVASLNGMNPDWLFKEFTNTSDGAEYKLMGERSRARKRPLVIERISDGQNFVTSYDAVKAPMLKRYGEPVLS